MDRRRPGARPAPARGEWRHPGGDDREPRAPSRPRAWRALAPDAAGAAARQPGAADLARAPRRGPRLLRGGTPRLAGLPADRIEPRPLRHRPPGGAAPASPGARSASG